MEDKTGKEGPKKNTERRIPSWGKIKINRRGFIKTSFVAASLGLLEEKVPSFMPITKRSLNKGVDPNVQMDRDTLIKAVTGELKLEDLILKIPAITRGVICQNCSDQNQEGLKQGNAVTASGVSLSSGRLTLPVTDIDIPGRGIGWKLSRTNNSQNTIRIYELLVNSGSWTIENGELSGEGDRAILQRETRDFTLTVRMKTIKPEPGESVVTGRQQDWYTGWINFRYIDGDNRYYTLLKKDGFLELTKFVKGEQITLGKNSGEFLVVNTGLSPYDWHTYQIVVNGSRIQISVDGTLYIDYTDPDPIPSGKIALEAMWSHAHFDDLVLDTKEVTNNIGDKLWNIRWFGCDYGHENVFALQRDGTPVCGSGNCAGPPSSCWGPTFTQRRREGGGVAWGMKENGALFLAYEKDNQVYGDSWLFVKAAKTINAPWQADVGRVWLNDVDITGQGGKMDLVAGWNHLEFTAYNQNQDSIFKIDFDFASNADLMNSSPLAPAEVKNSFDFNLQSDAENALFGYGWTSTYEVRVVEHPLGALILKKADGGEDIYIPKGDGSSYKPFEKGVFDTMTKTADGYLLRQKHGTTFSFDSQGKPLKVTDKNDNTLTFNYDGKRLVSVVDPSGRRLEFFYGANGKVREVKDPINRRWQYFYDEASHLIAVKDPMGFETRYEYYPNTHNLKRIIDREGKVQIHNSYYYNDRVATQTDALGNTTIFQYIWAETKVKNSKGEWAYGFSERDHVHWVKNSLGYTEGFAWKNGLLIGHDDFRGNRTSWEYDERGNQTSISRWEGTQAPKFWSLTEYEPNYNLPISMTDPNGNKTIIERDTKGNLIKQMDLEGGIILTEYNQYGEPIIVTDQRGFKTRLEYDPHGYLKKIIDPLGNEITLIYDAVGRLIKKIDIHGGVWEWVYDDNDNLLLEINPLQQKTVHTYDKEGRRLGITGPNNETTLFTYDAIGNLIRVQDPLQGTTQIDYNSANFILLGSVDKILEVNQLGHKVRYEFNALSQLIKIIDPEGAVTEYVRDPVGNIIQEIDPAKNMTKHEYDFADRKIKTISPKGFETKHVFDNNSNLIEVIDANNRSTKYRYDKLNRIIEVIDPENNVTKYFWNAKSELIRIEDALKNTINMDYDVIGRKAFVDDPDLGRWSWSYDDVRNTVLQTDARGQNILFKRDLLDRLISKVYPEGREIVYTYDEPTVPFSIGRLTKVEDLSGKTLFFYDIKGREVRSEKIIDGKSYVIEREFDPADQMVALKYPDDEIIRFTRNSRGQVTSIKGNEIYVRSVEYYPTGQIKRIEYGNGVVTNYTYDEEQRLTNLKTDKAGMLLQDLGYQFDPVDNILEITDFLYTTKQSFSYDDLYRLIQAIGPYGTLTYSYNPIGDLIQKEGINFTYGQDGRFPHALTATSDGSRRKYDENGNTIERDDQILVYDPENRLVEISTKGSAVLENRTLTYKDFNELNNVCTYEDNWCRYADRPNKAVIYGFMKKPNISVPKGTDKLDVTIHIPCNGYGEGLAGPANSSLHIVVDDEIKEEKIVDTLPFHHGGYYKYEYCNKFTHTFNVAGKENITLTIKVNNGARLDFEKAVLSFITNTSKKTIASFTYDGDGGRVKKITPSGTTIYIGSLFEITGSKITKHIFLGSNRIASKTGSEILWYHTDHLGSSNVITDINGNKVEALSYKPFGEVYKQEGQDKVKHKFTGKELDPESGFYFFGARYYDPKIGRFITADSIIENVFSPQTINRYSYVTNNPIRYIDPTGNLKFKDLFKRPKKFFKELWEEVKEPLINAAIVAVSTLIPGGPAFSWIAVASAAAATATLDTGEGRQLIKRVGREFFDDVLGMKPSTAQRWAAMTTYMGLNMAYQFAFASMVAPNRLKPVSVKDMDRDTVIKNTLDFMESNPEGWKGAFNYGGFNLGEVSHFLKSSDDRLVGAISKGFSILGRPQHIGIALQGVPTVFLPVPPSPSSIIPHLYGIWGISHQAVSVSLLEAGFSNTILSVGHPLSSYFSTFIYGPYGGGAIGATYF